MSTHPPYPRFARVSPLAACLAAALGLASFNAISGPNRALMTRARAPQAMRGNSAAMDPMLPAYLRLAAAKADAEKPAHPAGDHLVTSCLDDGSPGTLRSVVADPMTVSGDSINLTQLMCSTITLGTTPGVSGPIHVTQDELHIHGPAAGPLTIDGNFDASVFYHSGTGTLGISNVTIANGYYIGASHPYGGCISSNGNVLLLSSTVSNCTVRNSDMHDAAGGAIFTRGYLALFESVISGGRAYTQTSSGATGGGVCAAGNFTSVYSTVKDSAALPILAGTGFSVGGGVVARGNIDIEGSTFSRNQAQFAAGLELGLYSSTATVINSTISDNTALKAAGGIFALGPLTLANTTVAFNTSRSTGVYSPYSAGVYVMNALTLQSTIIADNKGPNGQDDLNGISGTTVMGANNLITSWNLLNVAIPANTLTSCPKLDPLADNGGSTSTHKLRHDSPAMDQGDPGTLQFDQRGAERVYGVAADIGSVEWQPTDQDERILASGFDGVCDW